MMEQFSCTLICLGTLLLLAAIAEFVYVRFLAGEPEERDHASDSVARPIAPDPSTTDGPDDGGTGPGSAPDRNRQVVSLFRRSPR
jgi:hypothetical protein